MNTIKTFAAAAGALLAASTSVAAQGNYHCYDFSQLSTEKSFTVGDVINTRHATITIRPYTIDGNPAEASTRRAEVAPSKIAGGTAPELNLKLVSVNVKPKKPVTKVRTRIAQNISQTGGFATANVGVNGDRRESPEGFDAMDGKQIGRPARGRAQITANIEPAEGSNWHSGTLELDAMPGDTIKSFTFGGHTWIMDDFCFKR